MGRHRRDLEASTYFHVMNRGADRQDIFSSDRDYLLFEALMAEEFERDSVVLHAYALMTNHFHLVVSAPNGALSTAMRRLSGRYATAYNATSRREGPVFTGRFRSVPIMTDAQLAQTVRYVHRNPLAFVPAPSLIAYRWSSLAVSCGRRCWPGALTAVGSVAPSVTDDHLAYVMEAQPFDEPLGPHLLGGRRTNVEDIDKAVATITGRSSESLRSGSSGKSDIARNLALMLSVEFRAAPIPALAEHYGLNDPGSVRRIARRARVDVPREPAFAALRQAVLCVLGIEVA